MKKFTKIRFSIINHFKILLISWVLSATPNISQAQTQVVNVLPRQNEINVPVNSFIEVTFSGDIGPATLNPSTWLVYGSQTGYYGGNVTYDASTRTARFLPFSIFKEGEIVYVTLTGDIRDNSGQLLASTFQWSFTISVEYGTGIFDKRIEIPIGENEKEPVSIFTGDFNNDLFLDLAVANNATNSVTILMNQFFTLGGSFESERVLSVGKRPVSITGGDFDQDGFLDLAMVSFDDDAILLLKNDGTGNFVTWQTIPTDTHPIQVEPQDFDNDGDLDLAVVIFGVNGLQIFLNQGNGNFTVGGSYLTGASPYSLTTGDFDNDGDLDMVVTNSGDNSIYVFKNNGRAQFTFSGEIAVPDTPTMVKSNDLIGRTDNSSYGDGYLDLVILHSNINAITTLDNRTRDGSFVVNQQLDVGVKPLGLFIGDVDTTDVVAEAVGLGKDHDLDIAVTNFFSQDLYLFRNEFNNDFSNQTSDVFSAGPTPFSVTGGDFDRDGDLDLATTNFSVHSVSVLMNKGGKSGSIRFPRPLQTLDFGQVYVGSDSTRILIIINPGGQQVTLDEIVTSNPVFTVSESQVVIPAGETYELAVTFSPADTVLYEETLTIRSNDFVSQPERSLKLKGEGIRAIIVVNPDTFDFGLILPPQSKTLPLDITNSGNGALFVTDFKFTNPVFSSLVNQLTVPAYSSLQVDITFTPAIPIAYLDTLTIINNDSNNAEVSVTLLGGANDYAPRITSADTAWAVEDVFFAYTATAIDSDGTKPQIAFCDLPSWLRVNPSNPEGNVVEGTPQEGDLDTSFVVIASDGLFSDSLLVYVSVLPVNDNPVINPVADQTVFEQNLLTFDVTAFDPEDSSLVFTSVGLLPGATFVDNGYNTATFTWTPPFGSAGVYVVRFVVTEVVAQNPLSNETEVKITVQETLPDLVAASLQITDANITQNQSRLVTGVARSDIAPVRNQFRLTFFHDGITVKDTTLAGLGLGQEVPFSYLANFNRLGSHEIMFAVDWNNQIAESNSSNNTLILKLKVTKGDLVVRPNPFTPNADGFNDVVSFDFSDLVLNQPQMKIFDFNGVLLTTLTESKSNSFQWDGRDSNGHEQKPGVYLYMLSDQQKRVKSGYLVLAR